MCLYEIHQLNGPLRMQSSIASGFILFNPPLKNESNRSKQAGFWSQAMLDYADLC